VRIDKGEAIPTLQVLERHRFDQCRLSSTGLSNDVDMGKTILVFYAEDAAVIAKIDPGKVNSATCIHWRASLRRL
jgi:hypothetical protein